jgi:hypothetical protein
MLPSLGIWVHSCGPMVTGGPKCQPSPSVPEWVVPCQKSARNCATRGLTPPHDATLHSGVHLRGCVGDVSYRRALRTSRASMVRMGSPVRFRRGLHHKPAGQAGSSTRHLASPRVAGRRLPEVCQLDLYALRRGGTCRWGAATMGDQPRPATGMAAGGAPAEPHHSLRVLTIMGAARPARASGGSTVV